VQPVSVKVSKTHGIFGRLLQMAFDFSDPGAASLKTSKDISAWGCPTSSKTWQEWVIERRGAYSQRLNAARRTRESGCSSWPTPQVGEEKVCMTGSQNQRMLSHAVIDGPLVPANSSTDGSRPGLWQTATVSTGAHKQKDGSMIDKLDQQVKSWATPSAFDGQRPIETQQEWEARNARKKEQNPNLGQLHKPLTVQMTGGGKLNPRWVETLMGLPVGWTMPSCASPVTIERMNCASSATESSPQPPH
jgi:hypothetical protein